MEEPHSPSFLFKRRLLSLIIKAYNTISYHKFKGVIKYSKKITKTRNGYKHPKEETQRLTSITNPAK